MERSPRRERLRQIIFEADTPAGRVFDVALLWAIALSVGVVMLESVETIRRGYGPTLRALEWAFTAVFTVEYALRLYCGIRSTNPVADSRCEAPYLLAP